MSGAKVEIRLSGLKAKLKNCAILELNLRRNKNDEMGICRQN